MRPVSRTLIDSVRAQREQVFALVADPARMPEWLPACTAVETKAPLKRGVWLTIHFGARVTGFEIIDFTPPTTLGWEERGARTGSTTYFQLEAVGGSTRITVRQVWVPRSFIAWLRGRLLVKRRVERTLNAMLRNLRSIVNSSA